jgi:hypothetical protein
MVARPSILADGEAASAAELQTEPACFADLYLDQVVEAVTAGKEEYNLKPLFYAPLATVAAVRYRQEVMQDLEDPNLTKGIESYAQAMHTMREHLALANLLHHRWQQARWFLDAAAIYCRAVAGLSKTLADAALRARGFCALRDYVTAFARSAPFLALVQETTAVQTALAGVQYCLEIKGSTVKVRAWMGEDDFGAEVQEAFARFAGVTARDYRATFSGAPEVNAVEGLILDRVALLYPGVFDQLAVFCARHRNFQNATLVQFDREVQFYLAYGAYVAQFRRQGLPLCYPEVSATAKAGYNRDGYDFALACKLGRRGESLVCNDFALQDPERILVVTGPNQGGKTTFARTLGQLHYLAALGLPVAGRAARLCLCDRIFTHFEVEENTADLRSKLEDDLLRLQRILAEATPYSLVILNEVFSSTTLQDAVALGHALMARLSALDARVVYVTFVDELATFDAKTVSMVSTVAPDNPTVRTYKIVRKPPDGLAYAHALAQKHSLTYAQIKERVGA